MRWAVIVALIWGCADLASVERLRCGNGLREQQANEDCDQSTAGSGFTCGEPGTRGACRYVCDTARCPDGWRCGSDGICRAGAGAFEPAWSAPIEGRFMTLGDLDGDGFPDLVTLSSALLQVAYGDSAGTFGDLKTQRISLSELPAAVGDLDDDGLDDIVVYTDLGLRIFPGREDRQLIPLATVSMTPTGTPLWAAGLRVAPPYDREDLVEVRDVEGALELWVARQAIEADFGDLGGPPDTSGAIAVGDLDGGATADELALYARRGGSVAVVELDCQARCVLSTVATLALPTGGALGTFFGDVDGDGRLDLLVLLEDEAGDRHLAVSHQDADGVLGPLSIDDRLAPVAGGPQGTPIQGELSVKATPDLSGDARAEFVTARGIWTFTDDDRGLRQVFSTSRPYFAVEPADFDGDGRTDLVGRRADSLDFLSFDDDGVRQRTLARPNGRDLAVGDFDGDGTDDVIIDQSSAGLLAITYAGADTAAADLAPFAQLDPAPTHLVAVRPRTPVPAFDLQVPTQLYALGPDLRLRFEGNGSGLPLTPLPVPIVGRDLAVGRFDGGRAALVGTGYDNINGFGRFVLRGDAVGSAGVSTLADPCLDPVRSPALARAVDFDRDGVDELLTLTSGVSGGPAGMIVDRPGEGMGEGQPTRPLTWSIHRARIQDGEAVCLWTGQVVSQPAPVDLDLVDLDGDGLDDIVSLLLTRRLGQDDLRQPGPAALAVWRGDATGHGRSEVFELPGPMLAASAVRLAQDEVALVLADSDRLWVARLVDDALSLRSIGRAPNGVQALRAADVDGDGLDDLVVKTATTVFVLPQSECSARDAWEGRCLRGLAP